ncbi:MAG: GH39 family glycosyl hydrolase [Acidimicrobiales bacterium]
MSRAPAEAARKDWEQRVGERSQGSPEGAPGLPAPRGLSAEPGVAQVTLRWEPVEGAAGYVVSRGPHPDGPFEPLDHGGSDVLAVPAPPYVDTDVELGCCYTYTVAPTTGGGRAPTGAISEPVQAEPLPPATTQDGPEALVVAVDAATTTGRLKRLWQMVGSERLSQLDQGRDGFGNDVGTEFLAALAIASEELGVKMVRAHAIFHDDLGVFSWQGKRPRFSFEGVDRVLDRVVGAGLRPVVELSFMPRDLASDTGATVFTYRAYISPPRDWEVWGELNGHLAAHLVERYGANEVAQWGFEVWNEPNLSVFWTGDQAGYFRLYETAARAVKSADSRLRVGGPATAAAEWVEDFAAFAERRGAPVDFVSTHTYGNVPIDLRPALHRHGLDRAEIWWTEWGVGSGHFDAVHGTAFDAPFILRGYKSAQDRADAVAYWVVSDHFEELGRPERLFHNGFGLLTVGNLRKPRFWAQRMANEMGDELVSVEVSGDGAGGLVDAWASRATDGCVDILVWDGGWNAANSLGVPALHRTVRICVRGLEGSRYRATLARIDQESSNVYSHFGDDKAWPDRAEWEHLRAADHLDEEALRGLEVSGGATEVEVELPMPGVVRLRLEPGPRNRPSRNRQKRGKRR